MKLEVSNSPAKKKKKNWKKKQKRTSMRRNFRNLPHAEFKSMDDENLGGILIELASSAEEMDRRQIDDCYSLMGFLFSFLLSLLLLLFSFHFLSFPPLCFYFLTLWRFSQKYDEKKVIKISRRVYN